MPRLLLKPSRGGLGGASPPTGDPGDLIAPGAPPASDPLDDSPTGRNPRLIWTPARQHGFNRMKADYLANTASPATFGGQLYKQMLLAGNASIAGGGGGNAPYGNFGQIATWLYQVTGEQAWADEAWRQINTWWIPYTATAGPSTPFDGNTAREVMPLQLIMLDWLWPGLSVANRAAYLGRIQAVAESVFYANYPGYGYPLGDSDQVVGHYMANAMFVLNHPNNVSAQAIWNSQFTGGFNATAANFSSNARNALYLYVTQLATGGEWIESSEYNPGTVYNLLTGYEAIKIHTGTDYFPDITAWLQDCGKAWIARWTPDLLHNAEWGEEESPGLVDFWSWANTLMIYAGVAEGTTQGGRVQDLYLDLVGVHGNAYNNSQTMHPTVYWRGPMFFNCYATRGDWTLNDKTFYAPGTGIIWQKTGVASSDSLLHIHLWPRPQDLDLLTDGGTMWPNGDHLFQGVGDFLLYRNGEWALNHPHGWTSAASGYRHGEGANVPVIHGMCDAFEYKKTRGVTYTDAYVYASVTTGGSLQDKYLHNAGQQPAVVLHEFTRSLLAVEGNPFTLIVYDRMNVDDIAPADVAHYYYVYAECLNIKRARKAEIFHTYTTPTVVGDVITSQTPGGTAVKHTILNPVGLTKQTFDEWADLYNAVRPGWQYGFKDFVSYPLNLRYQFQVHSNNKWDGLLTVIQVGTAGASTRVLDGTKAIGAHVTTGGNDILALFNYTQAADLNTISYHASHYAALDVAHYHLAKSFTIAWTAVAGTTDVYLQDLNPALGWTTNVDGAGAVTRVPDTGGHFKFSVSGAGAHSIVVTGT